MPKAKQRRRSAGNRRGTPKRATKSARSRRTTVVHPHHRAKPAAKIQDPRTVRALKEYARAMKFFNHQNYRAAKKILEVLASEPIREVAERARVHLNICLQRLQRPDTPRLRGGDDYYDYGVSLINLRRLKEAHTALEKARKLLPKADYVYYALASVAALAGNADEALAHLERAIRLRPENRFQARNDPDFQSLETDSRFRDLLYPEQVTA